MKLMRTFDELKGKTVLCAIGNGPQISLFTNEGVLIFGSADYSNDDFYVFNDAEALDALGDILDLIKIKLEGSEEKWLSEEDLAIIEKSCQRTEETYDFSNEASERAELEKLRKIFERQGK